MTTQDYEVVVTLVDGDARELSRTFESGKLHPPFSVGLQGDWVVTAEGVASVHLWLQFDGQRLYAACAAGETTYLQDMRLDKTRHEVLDRSELRFGQARMKVFRRAPEVPRSVAPRPAARVAPQRPAVRSEPPQLSPIERAAALPLPNFFSDRFGAGSDASPAQPEPRRARSRNPPRATPRGVVPDEVSSSRTRGARAIWLVLVIPVVVLAFISIFLWLTGFRRHAEVSAAVPASSVATLPPAAPASAPLGVSPVGELPWAPPPAVEGSVMPVPTVASDLPSTKSLTPTSLKAYRQDVTDKPVPRIGAEPWTISEEWRAHHERQLHAPNRARAQVVFLGDSITEGWGVSPAYRDSFGKYTPLNLGLSGDFTQNVLWRIDQGALTGTSPQVLVLMVGVNNLAGGFSPQETVAGIRAIIAAVQTHLPNARVLLLAILPARQDPADPLRQRIIEANRLLAALPASARLSIHDIGSVLLEPDGTLSKATTRDFIHPSAAGYERLSAAVAPLIDALMAHPAE